MNRSQIAKRGPLCVACFDVFFSFLTHFFVSFLFFVFPFAWPVKFGFVSFHKIYWNSIPLVEIIWYISLLAQTLCTRGNLITFSIYIYLWDIRKLGWNIDLIVSRKSITFNLNQWRQKCRTNFIKFWANTRTYAL